MGAGTTVRTAIAVGLTARALAVGPRITRLAVARGIGRRQGVGHGRGLGQGLVVAAVEGRDGLARGALDIVVESDVNILDIAALAVIVREAGGTFTDLDGAPLSLATRSVLAAVPAIHRQLVRRFGRRAGA